jgi:hypothetical protein
VGENENIIAQNEIDLYDEWDNTYKWGEKRRDLIQVGKVYQVGLFIQHFYK